MIYPIHPACAAWPVMSEAKLAELAEDIREHGLISAAVVTKDGLLLAGKNRQRACEIAGVELRVTVYEGDDPEGFTISENKHRQHYTKAELSLIGEELAKLRHGGDRRSNKFQGAREHFENASTNQVADQLGINRTLIKNARSLKLHGIPEVVDLVRENKVGIKNAAAYARHTEKSKQVADPKIIKREGAKLRTPNKIKRSDEKMVPLREVAAKFLPLFKRVKEQSTHHVAYISRAELRLIASEGKRLLREWADDSKGASRIGLHAVSSSDPANDEGD